MTESKRGGAEIAKDFAEEIRMVGHNKENAFHKTTIPRLTNSALSSAHSPPLRFAESCFGASALPVNG
jgi:hypothetical protein